MLAGSSFAFLVNTPNGTGKFNSCIVRIDFFPLKRNIIRVIRNLAFFRQIMRCRITVRSRIIFAYLIHRRRVRNGSEMINIRFRFIAVRSLRFDDIVVLLRVQITRENMTVINSILIVDTAVRNKAQQAGTGFCAGKRTVKRPSGTCQICRGRAVNFIPFDSRAACTVKSEGEVVTLNIHVDNRSSVSRFARPVCRSRRIQSEISVDPHAAVGRNVVVEVSVGDNRADHCGCRIVGRILVCSLVCNASANRDRACVSKIPDDSAGNLTVESLISAISVFVSDIRAVPVVTPAVVKIHIAARNINDYGSSVGDVCKRETRASVCAAADN